MEIWCRRRRAPLAQIVVLAVLMFGLLAFNAFAASAASTDTTGETTVPFQVSSPYLSRCGGLATCMLPWVVSMTPTATSGGESGMVVFEAREPLPTGAYCESAWVHWLNLETGARGSVLLEPGALYSCERRSAAVRTGDGQVVAVATLNSPWPVLHPAGGTFVVP